MQDVQIELCVYVDGCWVLSYNPFAIDVFGGVVFRLGGARLFWLFAVSLDFLSKISCFGFCQVVSGSFGYFPLCTVV